MKKILNTILILLMGFTAFSQIGSKPSGNRPVLKSSSGSDLDYFNPKEYVIGGTTIMGTKFLDKDVLINISKLTKGERIMVPGEATSNAIKNLWQQGLFDDVSLEILRTNADTIYFQISVIERPRLNNITIKGLRKGETTEIKEKLNDKTGKIINENLLNKTRATINKFLYDKGFFFAAIDFSQHKDPADSNGVILDVLVTKNNKVKVNKITFDGNKDFKNSTLRGYLKKTHQRAWYKLFGSGKFNREKYTEDKEKLIAKMHDKGYRDAELLKDTVYKHDDKTVNIDIKLHEGPKYYFGKITWAGNAKYPSNVLSQILGIEKGDLFSEEKLDKKLRGSGGGSDDVSSLYLNDGYLTFQVDPVQTKIYGDTVDLEMRIYEGPQYTINKVYLKGNTITNDKVVMREIRTKPGQKFSKDALVRTVQEIGRMGNFDEQKTNPIPKPNPADGTVDIEYNLEEKPSDQVELSGGFGGGRIVGTLGLTFNNFSARNLFNPKAWKPLPKGDGQKLSLRGQTNGKYYQSYSFSFSEPWLGGKKPIYFGVSAFTSLSSNSLASTDPNYNKIRMNGVTVSLGQRLKWPDDLFQISHAINLQQYKLNNYPGYLFRNGTSYNINLTQEISRNSIEGTIYPTGGSNFKFTIQATPPYSLLNNLNYKTASDKDRYRFVEYHKWKFEAQMFQRIVGKLVLKAQTQFGFLGSYNQAVGQSPFERFKVGGDGMQGFDFLQGSEIIALRGYSNNSVIPVGSDPAIAQNSGSPIFSKYVMELRHPVTLNQQATVFVLAFAEAGNTWNKFSDFNPFNVRRSVGVGARIFLPIFGMLGIDYGYGFDKIPGLPDANKGQFHFSIAQQLGGFGN